MITKFSKRLRYIDGVVVTTGGDSEVAEVAEVVADAVVDAVDAVAEVVAEATAGDAAGGTAIDHEGRIVALEIGFAAMAQKLAYIEEQATGAGELASAALGQASEAVTAPEVEAMIEATEITDTDGDGDADVIDAPDEPPAGTLKSPIFMSGRELKNRFLGRRD